MSFQIFIFDSIFFMHQNVAMSALDQLKDKQEGGKVEKRKKRKKKAKEIKL
jgi:hypothetical protein